MTAASLDDLFDQDWERIMHLDPADPRVADVSAERPPDDFYDLDDEDLASVPPEVCEDFLSDPFTGEGETFAAGFLHHEGGRRGRGFAAGGILDEMDAGPLLAWHGERSGAARYEAAARAIEQAVETAIKSGRATKDVGGTLGTAATGQAIVEILQSDVA